LGAARQTWDYTQDTYESAAQYCYSIANNHPFLDGNKRTATACMLVFLVKNNIKPLVNNSLLYEWVIAVTINTMQRTELASFLRRYCEKSN
jgi:death-on-curing protein